VNVYLIFLVVFFLAVSVFTSTLEGLLFASASFWKKVLLMRKAMISFYVIKITSFCPLSWFFSFSRKAWLQKMC
jgi:hypothetical protein